MNTLLAILKVIDARRDVILAGELSHYFAWRHILVWLESCIRWLTQTKRS